MRLLLDTHVWVWTLLDTGRVGSKARSAIESAANEIWLSPISVWEAMLLGDGTKLRLRPDPASWVRQSLAAWPLVEAPITHEIAVSSRRISLAHDDPADRFLAATAKLLNLTLVTADERLLRCREVKTLRA